MIIHINEVNAPDLTRRFQKLNYQDTSNGEILKEILSQVQFIDPRIPSNERLLKILWDRLLTLDPLNPNDLILIQAYWNAPNPIYPKKIIHILEKCMTGVQLENIILTLANRQGLNWEIYLECARVLKELESTYAEGLLKATLSLMPRDSSIDAIDLIIDKGGEEVAAFYLDELIRPKAKSEFTISCTELIVARFAENPNITNISFELLVGLHEDGCIDYESLGQLLSAIALGNIKLGNDFAKFIMQDDALPHALRMDARVAYAASLPDKITPESSELIVWLDKRCDELIAIGRVTFNECYQIAFLEDRLREIGHIEQCNAVSLKFNSAIREKKISTV